MRYLVEFIRTSQRGVILRVRRRRVDVTFSPSSSVVRVVTFGAVRSALEPTRNSTDSNVTRTGTGTRNVNCNAVKLGLIAGNGRFPFLVLDAARAQGTTSPSSRRRKRRSPS